MSSARPSTPTSAAACCRARSGRPGGRAGSTRPTSSGCCGSGATGACTRPARARPAPRRRSRRGSAPSWRSPRRSPASTPAGSATGVTTSSDLVGGGAGAPATSFESVAELLWTGDLPAGRPHWTASPAVLEATRSVLARVPASAAPRRPPPHRHRGGGRGRPAAGRSPPPGGGGHRPGPAGGAGRLAVVAAVGRSCTAGRRAADRGRPGRRRAGRGARLGRRHRDRTRRARRPRAGDLDAGGPGRGLDPGRSVSGRAGRHGRRLRSAARVGLGAGGPAAAGGGRAGRPRTGHRGAVAGAGRRCRLRSLPVPRRRPPGPVAPGGRPGGRRRSARSSTWPPRCEAAVARRAAIAPNVDFALATLVAAAGLPPDTGEALFALARTAGWLAHGLEEYAAPPLRYRLRALPAGVPTARPG